MNRNTTVRRGVVAACVALLALAGCTTPDDGPSASPSRSTTTSASPTSSPTPTVDPAIAAAEAAILEAYYGYWAAKVTSYADPSKAQDPNLVLFADDTALTDAQSTIFTLSSNGIVIPGEPALSPVVSDIELADPAGATITDCVDATNWQPIYLATGESAAAPDQSPRVVTVSTAFVSEGRWLIRTSVVQRDQTC